MPVIKNIDEVIAALDIIIADAEVIEDKSGWEKEARLKKKLNG